MKILAVNDEMKNISVDEFFAKHREFSENHELVEQTSRFLKVLLRHYRHPEVVADEVENGYTFNVTGNNRTYTILFEIQSDSIMLKEVQ